MVQCLGVSSQFESCRNQIVEMPTVTQEISRILYYRVIVHHLPMFLRTRFYDFFDLQNVPKLCQHATECVSLMSIDLLLQTQLFKAGVLWHLLLFLFDYDFTLEEGGVQKCDESNQQVTVAVTYALRSFFKIYFIH